jgi:hypothetical protein
MARNSCADTVPLVVDTLRTLCETDVSAVTSNIRSMPLPADTYARLAFLPTYAQALWHFRAEEYMASKVFKSQSRTPSIKGAISLSGQTWGYWVHDYNDNKLIFLRLFSSYPSSSTVEEEEKATNEVAAVLRAAQAEAADWSFHQVVIWNPQSRTLDACKLVLECGKAPEVRKRTEGSIPCLRWNGDKGDEVFEKGLEWIVLEKYCWC